MCTAPGIQQSMEFLARVFKGAFLALDTLLCVFLLLGRLVLPGAYAQENT